MISKRWNIPLAMLLPLCAGCWEGKPVEELTFVRIPHGNFTMGSPPSEPCRRAIETPHQVTLTKDVLFAATEVTQHQFQQMMGYNPSHFASCGPNCPVEYLNWHEAVAFCNRLSASSGYPPCYDCSGDGSTAVSCQVRPGLTLTACAGFRLPTEAEWEYAYRAGTATAYWNGANDPAQCAGAEAAVDRAAWYLQNSGDTTHPVRQKEPNPHGLYDLSGNVVEWMSDWLKNDLGTSPVTDPLVEEESSLRVVRGGGFDHPPEMMRAARRDGFLPDSRGRGTGFRCVRTLD